MSQCDQCGKSSATLNCSNCHGPLCKNCAEFLKPEDFQYSEEQQKNFIQKSFCQNCYQTSVWPELQQYEETLEKAKQVFVYYKHQGKETRLMKRNEKPLKVENCVDKDEATMKLAFQTCLMKHNALLDVELSSTKVRQGGYQTLIWKGEGIPTTLNEEKENKKIN